VKTGARKIRIGKTKRRRSKGESWEEERREREDEKTEKGKDDGSEEGGRRMGNME